MKIMPNLVQLILVLITLTPTVVPLKLHFSDIFLRFTIGNYTEFHLTPNQSLEDYCPIFKS